MRPSPDLSSGIRAILNAYPSRYRPIGQPVALGSGGGRSGSTLWRAEAPGGPVLLRGWPTEVSATRVETIHGWLAAAEKCVFVAQPIADDRGRSFVRAEGRIWQLEPWMPGTSLPAAAWNGTHLAAAFGALRELHEALGVISSEGPSPAVRRRLEEVMRLESGGLDQLRAAVGEDSGLESELARSWIAAAARRISQVTEALRSVETVSVRLQPCLRDCRIEHFLFEGERFAGLVDYGAMDVETPWTDVARLFVDLDDAPRRRAALEAYGRADAGMRLLEPLIASARLLIGAHWIRWHFVERRRFGRDDVAEGLRYGLERLLSPRG
jgi:homoserine kinase type II